MTRLVSNARMYAVSPEAEEAWRLLLGHVTRSAGVDFEYTPYPAPKPLEVLWTRSDLGCVFMCGFPIATKLADVMPIAAPIPAAPWAGGRAAYRSDLIVRADSPVRRLEDTFGGTLGWTVEHSHSGFNALRHHLLRHRRNGGSTVFRRSVGSLVTARKILDSVVDGTIDVGPLDSYWHLLIRRHRPDLVENIRVIDVTEPAPIPAFVASAGTSAQTIERLRQAFAAAADQPWFPPLATALCVQGFGAVDLDSFATTLRWAREAEAAGYPVPA